jgi:hypothetical protein
MSTSSKVKVSTEKLLEAVKARRAVMRAEYERAVVKYDKDREAYQGKVCDALRKALTAAEGGRLPEHHTGYREKYLRVTVRFGTADKPRLNTDHIDRLIATLGMAADASLTISAHDAAQYLG